MQIRSFSWLLMMSGSLFITSKGIAASAGGAEAAIPPMSRCRRGRSSGVCSILYIHDLDAIARALEGNVHHSIKRKGEGATLKTLCNSMAAEITMRPPRNHSKGSFPQTRRWLALRHYHPNFQNRIFSTWAVDQGEWKRRCRPVNDNWKKDDWKSSKLLQEPDLP